MVYPFYNLLINQTLIIERVRELEEALNRQMSSSRIKTSRRSVSPFENVKF